MRTPKYVLGDAVMGVHGTDVGFISEIRINADEVLYRRHTNDSWVEESYLCVPTKRRIKLNQRRDLRNNMASSRQVIRHFAKAIKEHQQKIREDKRALALLEDK